MEPKIIEIKKFLFDQFDFECNVEKLYGETDLNYLVVNPDGEKFVLKIAAPDKSKLLLEGENNLLQFLHKQRKAIETPVPEKDKSGNFLCRLPQNFKPYKWGRVLSWIDGVLWADAGHKSQNMFYSLGRALGSLAHGLEDFDHPAAHRAFQWGSENAGWVGESVYFSIEQRKVVDHFLDRFRNVVKSKFDSLRKSVVYNDANGHNLLLSLNRDHEYLVTGFIDFGDFTFSVTVSDLAIGIAYAVMDLPDPIEAACLIIKGYHEVYALEEEELRILYDLIALRLLISVAISAENAIKFPGNSYLQISSAPAWDLLNKMKQLDPAYVHIYFRHACGFVPDPKEDTFNRFLEKNTGFFPVLGYESRKSEFKILDLSVGSLSLGNHENYSDPDLFLTWLSEQVTDGKIGIGRYLEPRPFSNQTDSLVKGCFGNKWRSINLGIDFFITREQCVYAVWDGMIRSLVVSDRLKTMDILICHDVLGGPVFYTLYRNLNSEPRIHLEVGQKIKKGTSLGLIEIYKVDNKLPNYFHFQVLLEATKELSGLPLSCIPEEIEIFSSVCPFPGKICGLDLPKGVIYQGISDEKLLSNRKAVFGSNLSLSYQQPVHIVRGEMQFLIDRQGRRYLDMVNNVAHVGHENPRVVKAGQIQMGVLNTNTRYLHKTAVEFCQKLLSYFPANFEIVYMVNSGSEANELALRMARICTQGSELFVMQHGYHGNTSGCIEMSSYKFDGPGGNGSPAWVHVLPLPDALRNRKELDEHDFNSHWLKVAESQILTIAASDKKIAGFVAEPILSCAGQITPPPGFFKQVYKSIRERGGICIADEVQTGCGRIGSHFWAYELHGIVPDIVTIGKPIGNGHPLAAVVTTREIADAFDNGMEYFNTFGGNPVSSRIGLEVLDTIESDSLVKNADQIGKSIKTELQVIQKEFPFVGDVRGAGLFLGMELVRNPDTMEPNPEAAGYIVNQMKDRCILLATDGPNRNVIKIKPPLVITQTDVSFFVGNLRQVLAAIPS